ncbi:hypothetical protein AKJ16_DCAP21493 [Drosera capensis]
MEFISNMTKLQKSYSLYPMSSSSSSLSLSSTQPSHVGAETWKIAEDTIAEILSVINPTPASEQHRKTIIEYIQALFRDSLEIKVFPVGSVPLKTYLPDGDIDFTVLSSYEAEYLEPTICGLLNYEAKHNSQILVRDAQPVPAKVRSSDNHNEVRSCSEPSPLNVSSLVKLVKCTVENMAVDISFNRVDQYIGKENLFKRSIILIKAWCFYESRILGAHYGLFATYALETMILHIINLFHSSLPSPLAVFYKFLSYYSNFNWRSYCVSINGLVLSLSLPEIVLELPIDCDEPLLDDEFLRRCREAALASTGSQQSAEPFFIKHLNILDPLNDKNNLGKSINQGTYSRIQSAIKHGLLMLEELFMQPSECIVRGLEKLFVNTIARNRRRRRADVLVPVQEYGASRSEASDSNEGNQNILTGIQYGLWFHNYGIGPSIPHFCEDAFSHPWHNWAYDEDMAFQSIDDLISLGDSPKYTHFATGSMVEGKRSSRGTGTYIPSPSPHWGRDKYFRQRWTKWDSQASSSSVDGTAPSFFDASTMVSSSSSTDVDFESGKVGMCNLLPEGFPILPGSNPIPVKICSTAWPSKDTSTTLEKIAFGAFDLALPPTNVSLPPSTKQQDSEVFVNADSVPSVDDAIATMEEQEDSRIVENEKLDLPPFELGNAEEFPCLIPKIDEPMNVVSSVDLELEKELPCEMPNAEEEEYKLLTLSFSGYYLLYYMLLDANHPSPSSKPGQHDRVNLWVLMSSNLPSGDYNFPPLVYDTREEGVLMPPLKPNHEGNPESPVPMTTEEVDVTLQFELSNDNEFPPLLANTKKNNVIPTPMKLEDRTEFPPLISPKKSRNQARGKSKSAGIIN